jgi:hypothetical protein
MQRLIHRASTLKDKDVEPNLNLDLHPWVKKPNTEFEEKVLFN